MSEKILTSVGSFGFDPSATYDRARYMSATTVSASDVIEHFPRFQRVAGLLEKRGKTRFCGKIVLTSDHLHELYNIHHPVTHYIESAIPFVSDDGASHDMLVFLGLNAESRRSEKSLAAIIDETSHYTGQPKPITDRLAQLQQEGFHAVSDLSDPLIFDQLLQLWGPTFEWSYEQLDGLQHRIEREKSLPPEERGVWLTCIVEGQGKNRKVVSANMNEAITDANGRLIIESTEWETDKARKKGPRQNDNQIPIYEGRGLVTAAAMITNCQTLNTLHQSKDKPKFVIFGEFNNTTRSDFAANGAGFKVGDRNIVAGNVIPHVLEQSVVVDKKLSNFVVASITQESLQDYYPRDSIQQAMQFLERQGSRR